MMMHKRIFLLLLLMASPVFSECLRDFTGRSVCGHGPCAKDMRGDGSDECSRCVEVEMGLREDPTVDPTLRLFHNNCATWPNHRLKKILHADRDQHRKLGRKLGHYLSGATLAESASRK